METSRRRFGPVDALLALSVVTLLGMLAAPALSRVREASRRSTCVDHLRTIGVGLAAYESSQRVFPYAARWTMAGLSPADIHDPVQPGWPNITAVAPGTYSEATHENWLVLLVPFLEGLPAVVASGPALDQPMAASVNSGFRQARVALFSCPSELNAEPGNEFHWKPSRGHEPEGAFARGNYGINGGSHRDNCQIPGWAAEPCINGFHYVFDSETNSFQWWGTGVAGINRSFKRDEFVNGLSTLVAVEELRAGLHRCDPRGTWALGQIGSSITWAHGMNGDDCGPNNATSRADDVAGCGRLHEVLTKEEIARRGMPCCWYAEGSVQATSRSMHQGGVHVLMADGSERWIADEVDHGVWHVMHSRETPEAVLKGK
jgi:prepilin-type processing-associated H-X9-DG protein